MSLAAARTSLPVFGPALAAAGDKRALLATRITFAAVVAVMLISSMTLIAAGVPYASTGGSVLTKIHPATWIATVAVLAWVIAGGGGGRLLARVAIERPGVIAFGLATGVLFFQGTVVQKMPLSQPIDTFVLPILLFLALGHVDGATRRRMEWFAHGVLIVNALLGCFEYASGWRLTPMYDIDGSIIADWRSTALLGHPLVNAFASGCWLVILATGAAPRLHALPRLLLMGLAAVSLVAFGGRVAMVLAYAMVVVLALLGGLRLAAGGRFRLRDAVIAIALLTAFAVFAVVVIDAGGADRLVDRFTNDSGSAGTRVSMLRIFGDLTPEQFLLGPDPAQIAQAQRDYGIKIGIESSEVAFVAFYGLAVTVVFLAALGAYLAELVRATSWSTLWPTLFFVIVMSASTGLSSKSTILGTFTVMMLVMMPRTPPAQPRRVVAR